MPAAKRDGRRAGGQPAAGSRDRPWSARADGVDVVLRVSPGASRIAVEGTATTPGGDVVLRVRVAARPEGGKANDALIKLLARSWRLPKTRLTIVSGATDRAKRLHVAGDPEALLATLERWLASL